MSFNKARQVLDGFKNVFKNVPQSAYVTGTSTVSSATPLLLTVNSTPVQTITGAIAQTINLPGFTGVMAGFVFTIHNQATANVTVKAADGTTIALVGVGATGVFRARVDGANNAAHWSGDVRAGGNVLSVFNANQIAITQSGTQSLYQLPSSGTPAASTLATWDAQGNLSANSFVPRVGSPKLVSIGNRGSGSALLAGPASTAGTSEMMFVANVAATNISALWTHWYTEVLSNPLADIDPSGPITFSASLQVVSSTNPGTQAGTLYRLKFNGRNTVTLDPGGNINADPLGLSLAVGDVVAIRTYLSSGTAYTPNRTVGVASGFTGWGGFTATTDLTDPGSASITSSVGYYYGPAALLGHPNNGNGVKSVLVLGDSIAAGFTDAAFWTTPSLGDRPGFAARALQGYAGILNAAIQADRAADFQATNGSFRRLSTAGLCTSAIIEYGSNDIAVGTTAAAVEAINLNIASNLSRLGIGKVFITTLIPRVTSTDGYATTTNQTAFSGETQRVAYNTWIRAQCPVDATTKAPVAVGTSGALLAGSYGHPITGVFDTAATVESSLNSGKWLPANRIATGSLTTGTGSLTSSTAVFQTANQEAGGDKGTTFSLIGAGASGTILIGTLAVISSSTAALLDVVAGTTVTNTQLNINIMTNDGVHPSSRGHYLMSQAINTALL